MTLKLITLVIAGSAVAGCTVTEEITFQSKQEEACYKRVSAELPETRSLQRDQTGTFVEVFSTDGFVRDVEQSAAFDACMTADRLPGSGGDIGTITFTAEEQVIWNSLTDAARKDALEFIRNGGTLKQFVAQ